MKTKITTLTLAAILICSNLVNAANTLWTWVGSVNSEWSTKTNWSTTDNNSGIGAGDIVVINGGATHYPTLAGNETMKKFTMNGGSVNTDDFDFRCNSNEDFTINGGHFYAGISRITAKNLYIYGGSLTIDGNKLNINNDVVVDGGLLNCILNNTLIQDDLFLTSGTLDLNGFDLMVTDQYTYDADNSFSLLNPGTISINKLLVDFTGAHDLENNINVLVSAQFIHGILNTSSSTMLIFDNNAVATGASNSSHVNGPVRRLVSNSNSTFEFPVGNGSVFAPIGISNFAQTRTQDYFTAQYFYGNAPYDHGSKDNSLNHVGNAEYWILDRGTDVGAATTDVYVRLSFNETSRSGIIDDANTLRVARWDGSTWKDHGRSNATGNNTVGTFTTNSRVTNFSPFTFGSVNGLNPLPVSLLNFAAAAIDKQVRVSWSTSSEVNNDFFTVQKCLDGKSWSVIGIVDGVENSIQLNNYSFIDKNPINGIQFYRLIQTDLNGQSTVSNIVTVNSIGAILPSSVSLFPNPAVNSVNINVSESLSEANITIYNSMGVKVMELKNQTGSLFIIDMTDLEKGIYTIEVQNEQGVNFSKILKN